MKVSLELLFHYRCDSCDKWWTCADIIIEIGSQTYCPFCGKLHAIESVKAFAKGSFEELLKSMQLP